MVSYLENWEEVRGGKKKQFSLYFSVCITFFKKPCILNVVLKFLLVFSLPFAFPIATLFLPAGLN